MEAVDFAAAMAGLGERVKIVERRARVIGTDFDAV